jgi:hypothetical protein
MAGFRIEGNTSGNVAEVSAANQLITTSETDVFANPGNVGSQFTYIENDAGAVTGVIDPRPPEIDLDYRTRISQDVLVDDYNPLSVSQNTGRMNLAQTTMTTSFAVGQITTNSSSITTTTTGVVLSSYSAAPKIGVNTVSTDTELGFSANPVPNTFVEWGSGVPGGATAAPSDGVFFRLSSAGLQGIASYNGTETSTGVFPLADGTGVWTYDLNKKYQFIAYEGMVAAEFWVNDGTGAVKLGSIPLPAAQGRLCSSYSGVWFLKHRITGGAAGGVLQAQYGGHSVRIGGANIVSASADMGNRIMGGYQGLAGQTMGSVANYANGVNPTAAVPNNTTAALGTGLGGQFWETDTVAATTDAIISSFQVPAVAVTSQTAKIAIYGVTVNSFVQTALTGGGYVSQWSLAFGHTAVSLATAEAIGAKAPRRVALGVQAVASGAAVSTVLSPVAFRFDGGPIYVNPGEFIAFVKKKVGTAPSAGVIAHVISVDWGWA